ncbi:serine hydrolase [Brevundimonas sp.]|uniref:serine hydrolase domain-containing protein n=1 Tax=Brevundimonas sp. TaxID=1871086 RepID=UPI0025C39F51|nr:serine hydrolase domain-containing protein [Brevundimonas sp.]
MIRSLDRLLCVSAMTVVTGVSPGDAFAASRDPLAAMRESVQPGCAVAVLDPAGPRFDAAGLTDLEAATPITSRTGFLIASASKQFTALAVLTLVDAGRIELDAPAARWLPDMAGALQGATVRQLLNQTAGVRDHTILMALSGIERLSEAPPDSTLAMMRGLDSGNFAPGSRAAYSNGNYLMLAQLVERVSGRTLADYARETLFAPLGMTGTGFAAEGLTTHGYRRLRDGSFRIADDQPSLPGSGGLVTTAEDLARFDAAFRAGRGPWTATVKALFVEPGRLTDGSVAVLPEFGTPYGAGVGLEDRDGVVWLSHDGGSEGFRAEYVRQAETAVGAIVLCNRTDVNPGAIAEALLGVPATAPSPPAPSAPRPAPEPASESARAGLVGRWTSAETGIDYDIRPAEDGVRVTIRSPLSPEPITEDWGGLRAGADGEVVTGPLRLKADGDRLTVSFGRRVEALVFRRTAS